MERRLGVLLSVIALAVAACDTLIADRMTIRATPPAPAPSAADVLEAARGALDDCGLARAETQTRIDSDSLHWRNPKQPPGFHVMVHPEGDALGVTVAQDLFGPIGPTDAYRCVTKKLRGRLKQHYFLSR